MTVNPQVILRIGSHAEKEYFEKLANWLDGVIIGANLLEITPAATCSLLLSLRTKRGETSLPFFLDPMTYCFGPYIDPKSGMVREDMDSLKSDRLVERGRDVRVRSVKESYQGLAQRLGSRVAAAVGDGETTKALRTEAFTPDERMELCRETIRYQRERLQGILAEDNLMRTAFASDCKPAALFAPYFYIDDRWQESGLESTLELCATAAKYGEETPVHAVICASSTLLSDGKFVASLIDRLPGTGVGGVWLWFDGFDEYEASVEQLRAFRKLTSGLSGRMSIYNMHGGYFSMLLAHDGLSGISHGVGYGERKPVAQVIGEAAPTVRYYLPAIRKRIGVPELQRCLPDVGVKGTDDFFSKVCACPICKGVVRDSVLNFAAFGAMHRASTASSRDSQTPAAAKMCRFHFLINRMQERSKVGQLTAAGRAGHVRSSAAGWRSCYPLRAHVGSPSEDGYLERWAIALS